MCPVQVCFRAGWQTTLAQLLRQTCMLIPEFRSGIKHLSNCHKKINLSHNPNLVPKWSTQNRVKKLQGGYHTFLAGILKQHRAMILKTVAEPHANEQNTPPGRQKPANSSGSRARITGPATTSLTGPRLFYSKPSRKSGGSSQQKDYPPTKQHRT